MEYPYEQGSMTVLKILKLHAILLLCLLSLLSKASNADIADKIQQKFDSNLFRLKPIIQSHYAVRLYRITGKKEYLYPIISFQFIESMQLHQLLKTTPDSMRIVSNANTINLPLENKNLSKTKNRKALLAQFPEMDNLLKILLILDHAQQLNILNSPLYPHAKIAILQIKENLRPLSSFLLSPSVIKTSPAQVANFVFLLNRLKLIDLRKKYIHRFKTIFADNKDPYLSDKAFEDKIYGMTHIIFAASDYYQKRIAYKQFKWIYQYFEQHMDLILKRTKPDVVAEVGLTFCLLDSFHHSALITKIKRHLTSKYNPHQQMIPNKSGSRDLNLAEHRNVLTIMLFKWPLSLHSGPDLETMAADFINTLQQAQPL